MPDTPYAGRFLATALYIPFDGGGHKLVIELERPMTFPVSGRRFLATAAIVTGVAVTGFYGVRAATSEHNPPATIKTAPPRTEAAARRGYSAVVKKVVPAVVNIS